MQIRLPNHVGIAGAVFTSGKTINIPYAYADLRFNPAFDKQTGYFTRSILCVPIVNKDGKIIGVTQVLNKRGGPFTDEDESRLKAFTAQISIALENAKLFDDVQNMKNYNESMLRVDVERRHHARRARDRSSPATRAGCASCAPTRRRHPATGRPQEFFTGANAWVLDKLEAGRGDASSRAHDGRRADVRRRAASRST